MVQKSKEPHCQRGSFGFERFKNIDFQGSYNTFSETCEYKKCYTLYLNKAPYVFNVVEFLYDMHKEIIGNLGYPKYLDI